MLPTINRFNDAILKSQYLKKLSEELGVADDELLQELKKLKSDRPHLNFDGAGLKKKTEINPTEMLLLKLMLEEKGLISQVKERLEPADFQDGRASRIVSALFNLLDEGKDVEPNLLIASLGDEVSEVICGSVFLPEITGREKEKVIDDCIHRLKNNRLKMRKQHIHEEIKMAQSLGDEEKLHRLMQEFHYLIKKG
jgi:DNA primase